MTMRPPQPQRELAPAAIRVFTASERLNQLLIQRLDPAIWRSAPPGNVRPVAAIFTHIHNVRTKWIRLTAPHLPIPPQLNRARCTPGQASAALAESALRCHQMLADALSETSSSGTAAHPRIAFFRRDSLARPWPVGVEMLAYMLAHEAHHRGQVCMLAHQLGYPLPGRVTSDLWNWEKLWKDIGTSNPRGR